MEGSGTARDVSGRGARAAGPGTVRRAGALLAATLGSVAGGLLVVPLMIVTPNWLFLTLPQVISAVFASSMAYLAAGPAGTALSRTSAASLVAAVVCALVNIALLEAVAAGVIDGGDLLLPGGWATHFLEAAVVGVVASLIATGRGRARPTNRLSFWMALIVSIMSIATLLVVGRPVLEGIAA